MGIHQFIGKGKSYDGIHFNLVSVTREQASGDVYFVLASVDVGVIIVPDVDINKRFKYGGYRQ